ncbi:MAG TPA: MarR family winged helix-turn-helix transcriptional regulator [Steroidobacteraceae bacterium]|nr:MarR family winged helix-turn-helix transcriptional regulator [Steroidobacteraceae bacterium]
MINDPVKDLPGYTLRRVSAAFMAKLAARLSRLELRPAESTVLLVIAANPGVTQSEVGRLLGIASANMAPLVARLADRDLIVREAVDGRSHGLTLAEAGRRITQKARAVVDDLESELLARIPPPERAGFLKVLAVLASDQED